MTYKVLFTSRADKDKKLLKSSGLERKVKILLDVLTENPSKAPSDYEKLVVN